MAATLDTLNAEARGARPPPLQEAMQEAAGRSGLRSVRATAAQHRLSLAQSRHMLAHVQTHERARRGGEGERGQSARRSHRLQRLQHSAVGKLPLATWPATQAVEDDDADASGRASARWACAATPPVNAGSKPPMNSLAPSCARARPVNVHRHTQHTGDHGAAVARHARRTWRTKKGATSAKLRTPTQT